MARIKVAIFDGDKGYRERFADYLMSYKSAEMELSVFTNISFFKEALDVDKFHLLVLGSGYEEVLVKARAKRIPILVLTESVSDYVRESVEMLEDPIVYAFKYQSMDGITRQMQLMTEGVREHSELIVANRELKVIGVISPVKHEMQNLFSMLYAKNVGRKERVLYINLLEFSGFSEIFGEEEYDIGDAILQIREGLCRRETLLQCIYEEESFSYITPFLNPENVAEVTAADIKQLLEWIGAHTDFQTVVIDMSINVKGFPDVLQLCTKIFCIGKKGYLFEIQVKQFLIYVERAIDEIFLERMEQIELPNQRKVISSGINLLEQLDWGEFGDFVRSKL